MSRALVLLIAVSLFPSPAGAQEGRVSFVARAPFVKVADALEQAVAAQKMVLVCRANAQQGAAARGVTIGGNQVFMVFRNDFAVRLIKADPRAAYEAPIRIYLYENPDGTATVSYVRPSTLFAPYTHPEIRAVGSELDPIFKAIVDQALGAR
jgi:uncharacterized protein (DUF302 family)